MNHDYTGTEIRLVYHVKVKGELEPLTKKPQEFSDADWNVIQTHADVIRTSKGFFHLKKSYGDSHDGGALYLTYEKVDNPSPGLRPTVRTRPSLEALAKQKE